MARQQTQGLTGAVLGGVFAGDLEGVEAMEVAARGQHVGRAQEVAAGGGIDEASVERLQDAPDFVILRQMLGGGLEGAQDVAGRAVLRDGVHGDAGHQSLHRSALQPLAMGGFGHCEQHVGALVFRERLAHHMQAMGDQRIFEFEDRLVEPDDLRLDVAGPEGLGRRQIKLRRLGLDENRKLRAILRRLGPVLAPAIQRGLEIDEAAIEARAGDRGRQIADEGRRRPALGDGAFGGVVGGVEIEVRQVRDQPIRPAGA